MTPASSPNTRDQARGGHSRPLDASGYWLLLLPLGALYAVMIGVPLFLVFREGLVGGPDVGGVFLTTIANRTYLTILSRTMEIAAVTTVFCVLLGFPLAYAAWRAPPLMRAALIVAVLFPYWTSVVVRAFGWQVLLKRDGIVPNLLHWLGLIPANQQLSNGRLGLYLGLVQILLPYLVLPVLATLSRLDFRIVEAAYSAGAGPLRAIRTVVIPLAAPGVMIGSLIVFAIAAGSFVIPVLLGGLGDTMIAQVIAMQASELLNWPAAMALSILLIGVSMAALGLIALAGRRAA